MTLIQFAPHEPSLDSTIPDSNFRWERHIPGYASSQRKQMITKLALSVFAAWAAVAGSTAMIILGDNTVGTFGVVLTSATTLAALLITIGFINWGQNLRKIDPIKYDNDNKETAFKIINQIYQDPLRTIANEFEGKTAHLKGSGLFSKAEAKQIKKFTKKYFKISEKLALSRPVPPSEDIQEDLIPLRDEIRLNLKIENLFNQWLEYQNDLVSGITESYAIPSFSSEDESDQLVSLV